MLDNVTFGQLKENLQKIVNKCGQSPSEKELITLLNAVISEMNDPSRTEYSRSKAALEMLGNLHFFVKWNMFSPARETVRERVLRKEHRAHQPESTQNDPKPKIPMNVGQNIFHSVCDLYSQMTNLLVPGARCYDYNSVDGKLPQSVQDVVNVWLSVISGDSNRARDTALTDYIGKGIIGDINFNIHDGDNVNTHEDVATAFEWLAEKASPDDTAKSAAIAAWLKQNAGQDLFNLMTLLLEKKALSQTSLGLMKVPVRDRVWTTDKNGRINCDIAMDCMVLSHPGDRMTVSYMDNGKVEEKSVEEFLQASGGSSANLSHLKDPILSWRYRIELECTENPNQPGDYNFNLRLVNLNIKTTAPAIHLPEMHEVKLATKESDSDSEHSTRTMHE